MFVLFNLSVFEFNVCMMLRVTDKPILD